MSKLITALLLTILVFGLALALFGNGRDLPETIRTGHDKVSHTLRSFDYVTD
ncbi:hypothetical protein [Gorillibacterium sp. CAU 1737]|uniref:hypothetical protein n=1 Tax=Gorillibacterium sp. CAU 1737 TaxID=3140362 RepID=UPI003261586D